MTLPLELQAAIASDKVDKALDIFYLWVDTCLYEGKFKELDEILLHINVEETPLEILLGLLISSNWVKLKLSNRHGFYDRVEKFTKETGQWEPGLLTGLEP